MIAIALILVLLFACLVETNYSEKTLVYLTIILCALIIGCSITHSSTVKLAGNNIKTPYGSGDVNSEYSTNTTWSLFNGR